MLATASPTTVVGSKVIHCGYSGRWPLQLSNSGTFNATSLMYPSAVFADSRNFRRPTTSVIKAVQAALEFDKDAGLDNNVSKFAALSTTDNLEALIAAAIFNGSNIKVNTKDNLIGMAITTGRQPMRARLK